MYKLAFIFVIFIVIILDNKADCYSGGIKLKDVDNLIFKANQYTNSRRGDSEPQLKCTGGPNKCKYQPKFVKCHNVGIRGSNEGYKNIQWRCEADLMDGYSFDKIRVNCEPFEHPNDIYVVKGSCSLEYALDYDEKDKDKDDEKDDEREDKKYDRSRKRKDIGNWLIWAVTKIPKKSAELFFRNIFTFVIFSAIVYLFFFGWPTFPNRRRRSIPPWDPDNESDISYNRPRFNRQEREESIWATILKVILEFAFEKLLKAFIR